MVQVPPPIVHNEQSDPSRATFHLLAGQCPPSFVPPTRRPAVRRRATGTTLAVLALLGGSACKDASPATTPATAPQVSAPVTTRPAADSRADAERKALAAYRGLWKAYAKAGLTANADEPDLAEYAVDPALKMLRDALTGFKAKGQVFKGEYGSRPTVAEATPADSPTAVVLADCLDSKNFLVYKTNGELADDKPGGRRSASATVHAHDGTWKVTSFAIREKGTC
jgi:hypothetical protein